jgi:hypothetical protein
MCVDHIDTVGRMEWLDPADAAAFVKWLDELLRHRTLEPESWQLVEEILAAVESALRSGDAVALDTARYDLRAVAGRHREKQKAGRPPPATVISRLHSMVDSFVVTEAMAQGPAPSEVRCVNTRLTGAGQESSIPRNRPLAPATRYDVLLNIGAPHPDSLLPADEAGSWPGELLPGGDLRLHALLRCDGMDRPSVLPFTLPERGDGPWVRFPLTTPRQDGVWRGQLAIYYENVVVHAQQLELPVGAADGAPRSVPVYRLTTSFADLAQLRGRTASMLLSPDASRLLVNGESLVDSRFSIDTNKADNASRAARDLLFDIHLDVSDGTYRSRYDDEFRKPRDEFLQDLRRLALAGRQVYCALFDDASVSWSLPQAIRHAAAEHGRPAALCVAEPPGVQQREAPIPWSLVYDLPVDEDLQDYEPCESMRWFGPGGDRGPTPPHCPVDHAGAINVLCPFGFWGLSCLLEQPPSTDSGTTAVVYQAVEPPAVLVAVGSDLDDDLTARHLDALRRGLGDATAGPPIDSKDALGAALAAERMDVAYLYCHCGYLRLSERAAPSVYLPFGGKRIGPLTIDAWAAGWPRPHWPTRKPLVVLNGCHTVDTTSSTLVSFVKAFIGTAGAAGMIGTEVTLEQGLAGRFMEHFLERFVRGATVGEAMREARWRLLALGNVMGLAYTPYCLSNLRIRAGKEQLA